MTLVPKCKSLNDYFVKMLSPMLILLLPCIILIPNNIVPKLIEKIIYLIPSVGSLKLMIMAVTNINILDMTIGLIGLVATLYIMLNCAYTALKKITID